ncbi:hypothetical protein [Afipia sp. GAS231]|uniref:hypothetical protein n=1 Tax=Afipia sp. GAS231 TaxID=1882747 RepID=UPI00087D232A|nr:hypothetical protein [Afipia sp. GAS231]SDN10803.1 hypothetical protein SAMN05444050_0690 [Afipia sp. GAS231]
MTRARTVIRIAGAILGLTCAPHAFAQQAPPSLVDTLPRGHYVRSGLAFACVTEAAGKLSHEQFKVLEYSCLRMGPLHVGMGAAALKGELGQPSRQVDGPNGTKVWVYFFGKTNNDPYLAASIWQDKLVAIQVTGRLPEDKFGFNGIALGAAAEDVTKQLGKPMVVRPSSEPNTDLWSYQPWTFSVEISSGRVTSIRVADPKFN